MPRILRPHPPAHPLCIALLPRLRLGDPFVFPFRQDVLAREGALAADVEVAAGLGGEGLGLGEENQVVKGQGCGEWG